MRFALLLLVPFLAAPSALAQSSISYGQSRSDYLPSNARHHYTFYGTSGDIVTISMTGFDTYLELNDPYGNRLTSNDDGGDGLDARISNFRLHQNGTHTIVARGFASASGSYTLRLTNTPITPPGRTIAYGESRTGYLGSSDRHPYTFYGTAGDVVRIDLISSFDNYLELNGPSGSRLTTDDDGGDGLNARISGYRLPQSGTYTIIARPYGSGSGSYSLSLSSVYDDVTITAACRTSGAPDYGGIRVGSYITLGRHLSVNGGTYWSDSMERYVGTRTRVTRLDGTDPQGCAVVRVEADGEEWRWRVTHASR